MKFYKQVNMIIYNLQSMNFIALLIANGVEDQLAILFNSLIVEYFCIDTLAPKRDGRLFDHSHG